MTTTQGVWMTRRAYIRLQAELAGLRSQPAIEVPDDFMDYDDNLVAAYQRDKHALVRSMTCWPRRSSVRIHQMMASPNRAWC